MLVEQQLLCCWTKMCSGLGFSTGNLHKFFFAVNRSYRCIIARHTNLYFHTSKKAFFVSNQHYPRPQPCGTHCCYPCLRSRSCFSVPGTSTGLTDVDPLATEITNVVIGNLGGTGTYKEVMSMAPGENMQCTDTSAACVQEVRLWLN